MDCHTHISGTKKIYYKLNMISGSYTRNDSLLGSKRYLKKPNLQNKFWAILVVISIFLVSISPYVGAMACSALIIFSPKKFSGILVLFSCLGLIVTSASKTVGLSLSDDMAGYHESYIAYAAGGSVENLYASFAWFEVALPSLYILLEKIFGVIDAQYFTLIFSIICVTSFTYSVNLFCKFYGYDEKKTRAIVGFSLLLYPALLSVQLLRQFLSVCFFMIAICLSSASKRAIGILFASIMHFSSMFVLLVVFVSAKWSRIFIFLVFFSFFLEPSLGFLGNTILRYGYLIDRTTDVNDIMLLIRPLLIILPALLLAAISRPDFMQRYAIRFLVLNILIFILAFDYLGLSSRLTFAGLDIFIGTMIGILLSNSRPIFKFLMLTLIVSINFYGVMQTGTMFLWGEYNLIGPPWYFIYEIIVK